ncbi:MAG: hypothetical protein IJI44_06505 [Erysipelotrichaceae bacterium]|nr:hypothetical protein [Erysipelotrichaceae bacterium]
MIISDKEYITEDFMQYQIDNDMFFKMTVLEDGAVFIDFISEQMRGYINPETSTIGIGSNGIPFTYENGTMTLVTTAEYVYTFEKKDDLSPVVMLYRNDYFILEDPYLLPWANVPDEDGTGLFLFSKQIWLVEHSYPKDDESEELREALNLFQDNNPLMDLNEGTHYSYTEDGDAFFLDVLFVTPTNYHYFRMWCPSSDRDKYEDLLVDLMSNHVYVLEYYQ